MNLRTTKQSTVWARYGWTMVVTASLVLLFATSGNALAQFDSGAVLGNIKDPSGATIVAATVELLNLAKGVKVVHQTDANGGYEFDSVQAGEYLLSVSAPGFQGSRTDAFNQSTVQQSDPGKSQGELHLHQGAPQLEDRV